MNVASKHSTRSLSQHFVIVFESRVRHATHAKTGAQVAIKIMDKAKIKSMEMEAHIKHEVRRRDAAFRATD